jgi:acetoin utilization protein AcuB
MASGEQERRQARRFSYLCEARCEAHGGLSIGRITNISTTGAWIETSAPPTEGSILKLCFTAGLVDVTTQARVVHQLLGKGMGIAFQDLSPQHREAIEALSADASREEEQNCQMQIHRIMTTKVVTVSADDKVKTLQDLFERFRFHHLLVIDEDKSLVGVISDRDLLKALSPFIFTLVERPQDLRTLEKRVCQIMSHRKLITASKNQTVGQAAILMLNNNISCLPVVSHDKTIEGIVTWKDIFRWLVRQLQE